MKETIQKHTMDSGGKKPPDRCSDVYEDQIDHPLGGG